MRKKNKLRSRKIIAVVSGKGGVGKTSIVANLGKILSKTKKVILIDLDLYVRGLTHFVYWNIKGKIISELSLLDYFEEFFLKKPPNYDNIKTYLDKNINKLCVKIEDNLFLIPSATSLKSDVPLDLRINENAIAILLEQLRKKYEYIIIDTRAGSDKGALISSLFSDECIIVSEEDVISQMSSYTFILHIGRYQEKFKFSLRKFGRAKILPSFRLLFNKVIAKSAVSGVFFEKSESSLRSAMPSKYIRYDRGVKAAFLNGKYIVLEKPRCSFSRYLKSLANEFEGVVEKVSIFERLSSRTIFWIIAIYLGFSIGYLLPKINVSASWLSMFIGALVAGFLLILFNFLSKIISSR